MAESDEANPPPMPNLDAQPPISSDDENGKSVKIKISTVRDWSSAIRIGYGMLLCSLLLIVTAALDDGPDSEDYQNTEDYYDAIESYQDRQTLYPGLILFLFLGGVVSISGGLVTHGVNQDAEMHHYVRIAVIISGVFILSLFVSGFFDLVLAAAILDF
tara:strand:- start:8 stop:484 length:477 start_codon:yes stop_codon:yes gene_type:complete